MKSRAGFVVAHWKAKFHLNSAYTKHKQWHTHHITGRAHVPITYSYIQYKTSGF